jgi:hypothetical protein
MAAVQAGRTLRAAPRDHQCGELGASAHRQEGGFDNAGCRCSGLLDLELLPILVRADVRVGAVREYVLGVPGLFAEGLGDPVAGVLLALVLLHGGGAPFLARPGDQLAELAHGMDLLDLGLDEVVDQLVVPSDPARVHLEGCHHGLEKGGILVQGALGTSERKDVIQEPVGVGDRSLHGLDGVGEALHRREDLLFHWFAVLHVLDAGFRCVGEGWWLDCDYQQ